MPLPEPAKALTWADLTDEEVKNGWTPAAVAAYRAERDAATGGLSGQGRVGGNVVTHFKRPRPPLLIETATHGYNPHKWQTQRG